MSQAGGKTYFAKITGRLKGQNKLKVLKALTLPAKPARKFWLCLGGLAILSGLLCEIAACAGQARSATEQAATTPPYVYFGDGSDVADGRGSSAKFHNPASIASDTAGNLYIADTWSIRKISPDADVVTLAGKAGQLGFSDGKGEAARFSVIGGAAVDSEGTLYASDEQGHTIRKITPEGVVTTIAGKAGVGGDIDGSGAEARFTLAGGLAIDQQKNLYIVSNLSLRKLTPDGNVSTVLTCASFDDICKLTGSAPGVLGSPGSVVIDKHNNLFISDKALDIIWKIAGDGSVTAFSGSRQRRGYADGLGSSAAFNSPSGLAIDAEDNLYVADTYNHVIRKITPAGLVTTIAGKAGSMGEVDGRGDAARFTIPVAVAVGVDGAIYVADGFARKTIRKISRDGQVSTFAGH